MTFRWWTNSSSQLHSKRLNLCLITRFCYLTWTVTAQIFWWRRWRQRYHSIDYLKCIHNGMAENWPHASAFYRPIPMSIRIRGNHETWYRKKYTNIHKPYCLLLSNIFDSTEGLFCLAFFMNMLVCLSDKLFFQCLNDLHFNWRLMKDPSKDRCQAFMDYPNDRSLMNIPFSITPESITFIRIISEENHKGHNCQICETIFVNFNSDI